MIDPKLIESAAKALGDARDRMLALLPEKNCLTCAHEGKNDEESPCDECMADPTSGNWTPKEPLGEGNDNAERQPAWDEVPEFGDEVEEQITGTVGFVEAIIGEAIPVTHIVTPGGARFGISASPIRVTRKAVLRVGDIAESRTTGRRGYVCKICCHWALNAWGRIEHNLTRADLKLIARGEKP